MRLFPERINVYRYDRHHFLAMSEKTREHLDTFRVLPDKILNAVLFLLTGLEVIVLSFSGEYILAGFIPALIVLPGRFISAGIPVNRMRLRSEFHPPCCLNPDLGWITRGTSVALALSLPAGNERDTIVAITYIIVVQSIVMQGLKIKSWLNLPAMAPRR